ncbi:hypothetical protein BGX26_000333 [Mortierella sp. AD094]|nr:hypothetical protein BGX26_000333 [Mortierella sp. AD094]
MSQTPICTLPTCSPVCSPSCQDGYTCSLSVINSTCQCPTATCAKIGFDTGADNGDGSDNTSSSKSVIGPVVGAIAGLGVILLIAIIVIRRRRRRAVIMLGQDDSFDSLSKRWNSTASDSLGNKDVIRIAYIPSIIGESPISNPEPSAQTGGVLKPNFTALKNADRSKHDSVSSLDEAVVMAVTSKATPQVMKLGAIKANQSDLIHRSNSLHTSNSVKRSQSQRRIAKAKNNTGGKNPSPLGLVEYFDRSDTDADSDIDGINAQLGGSKDNRLSALSDVSSNPFMTEEELASSTNTSSITNRARRSSTDTRATSRSSNPFLSIAESTIVSSPTSNLFTPTSSQPGSPMSDTTAVFASIPITLGDPFNNDDPLSGLPAPNLRPWTSSSASTAMRDSTFSTISDSRSSTRGDGEEIMIFWGGDRDSKANM